MPTNAEISLNNAISTSVRAFRLVETLDLSPNRQTRGPRLTLDARRFFFLNVSFLSAQALQIMAAPSISLLKKSPTIAKYFEDCVRPCSSQFHNKVNNVVLFCELTTSFLHCMQMFSKYCRT